MDTYILKKQKNIFSIACISHRNQCYTFGHCFSLPTNTSNRIIHREILSQVYTLKAFKFWILKIHAFGLQNESRSFVDSTSLLGKGAPNLIQITCICIAQSYITCSSKKHMLTLSSSQLRSGTVTRWQSYTTKSLGRYFSVTLWQSYATQSLSRYLSVTFLQS